MVTQIMKINKQNTILLFFITSFLGWLMETIGTFIVNNKFENRGIMFLPFCPIYGVGVTLIFILIKIPSLGYQDSLYKRYILENSKVKLFTLYCSYAVIFGLICGILEFFTGLFIDILGIEKLWTYQGTFDSINGYVRLTYVVLFGVFGTLYMRYVYKNIYLYLENKNIQKINIVLLILLFSDIIMQLFIF